MSKLFLQSFHWVIKNKEKSLKSISPGAKISGNSEHSEMNFYTGAYMSNWMQESCFAAILEAIRW